MAEEVHDEIPADLLIDEVRAIRKEISDRFGNDVSRLAEYLREQEKQHPERICTSVPNRSQPDDK